MLIAIDWGTTNFRAYLLDDSGKVTDKVSSSKGVTKVNRFPRALDELIGRWNHHGIPKIMSGMVGSTKGWVDVPYVSCPVSFDDLSSQLYKIDDETFIVPGVNIVDGDRIDVMRGEETQVFGAKRDGLFCLPGTHSKWVALKDRKILDFKTYMSGELFQVCSEHTILNLKDVKQIEDDASFMQGIEMAQNNEALSSLLFTVRSSMLFDKVKAEHTHSYLSGLLVGVELKYALQQSNESVYIIAEPSLASLYQLGLEYFKRDCDVLNAEEVTVSGLYELAKGVL